MKQMLPCRICGGMAAVIYTTSTPLKNYFIFRCVRCGVEFTDPTPSETDLAEFYAGYSDVRADDSVLLANAKRNAGRLGEWGRMLDFGSGKGVFADFCKCERYDPYFGPKEVPDGTFDTIVLWGVLEHVVNPRHVMAQLSGLLADNGRIALTTVWRDGGIPYQHKPPEHLWYFTKMSLEQIVQSSGLTLELIEPYRMVQRSDIYLDCVLRTVPDELRSGIRNELPELVEVPTNECFLTARKRA